MKRNKHEYEATKGWEAYFDKSGFSNLLSSVKAALIFVQDAIAGGDSLKYFLLLLHTPKLGC